MAKPSAGEAFEISHVHDVYDQIAPHFSSTRYKVRMSLIEALLYVSGRLCQAMLTQ